MDRVMDWTSLLSSERLGKQSVSKQQLSRSAYQKDYDRIIFSNAFRRLDKKTQVHPLPDNDHVHTRLIHSIEVSCIGRSLGCLVGKYLDKELPEAVSCDDVGAIVQAACVAHDIGNPPFGHTGERAIQRWFQVAETKGWLDGMSALEKKDLQCFEGNAQGFRVVTQLENYRFQGGMRLTHATLGAFIKYPFSVKNAYITSIGDAKFGCNQSEMQVMSELASHLGLIPYPDGGWCRHPLAYLMEAADDICYAIMDLEDAVEVHILECSDVQSLMLDSIDCTEQSRLKKYLTPSPSSQNLALLRGKVMDQLVQEVADAFMQHLPAIMCGQFTGGLLDRCDTQAGRLIKQAKSLAKNKIFCAPQKSSLDARVYNIIDAVMSALCVAARDYVLHDGKTQHYQQILDILGDYGPSESLRFKPESQDGLSDLYCVYLRVMDYVSGMTDSYTIQLASQLRRFA